MRGFFVRPGMARCETRPATALNSEGHFYKGPIFAAVRRCAFGSGNAIQEVCLLSTASGRACAMAPRGNVVTWTDDDRRELRELCRVHDQMMAEQWANDPGEELVFKVMEDARPPVPEAGAGAVHRGAG